MIIDSQNELYKISFTNASMDQKKRFKDSSCLITISVGNAPHESLKFSATLKLINKSFKSCMIAVCDTLQKYTLAITRPLKEPEDLYDISKKEGDKWLERNKEAITNLTIPCVISRWDEWLNHKEFKEYYKKVCDLCDNDTEYANIMNEYTELYLDRLHKQQNNSKREIDYTRGRSLSIRYLKEECAAMCSWFYQDQNYDFELYPPVRNKVLDATYERLVNKNSQHLLAPIGLRFKKSKVDQEKYNNKIALANIIAKMPGHLYWKNEKGVYMGCNDKQAASLGLKTGSEVVGKTDLDLPWGKRASDKIMHTDKLIMSTKKTEIIEEIVKIDGKKSVFLSQKSPLLDLNQKVAGVLGVSVDITKQKILEAEYIEKTHELNNALEVKRNFINNLSHEIRIPLHSVTAITNEIYDQWDTMPDTEKKEYFKTIVDSQNRLMSLVTNLLDLSKIKSGKLSFDFAKNDLIVPIKEVVSEFKYLTEPITLSIDSNLNTVACFDVERIKQVLRNLMSNSIKYGGKDKPINIRVFSADNKCVGISIADQGIGVPEEEKDSIFELFKESSRTKTKAGGIGLGLAIIKDIILAHRGDIYVENNGKIGSIFTFTIPVIRIFTKKHILVTDDALSV